MNTAEFQGYMERFKAIELPHDAVRTHSARVRSVADRTRAAHDVLTNTVIIAAQMLPFEMGSDLRCHYGKLLTCIEEVAECLVDLGKDTSEIMEVYKDLLRLLRDIMMSCYEEKGE